MQSKIGTTAQLINCCPGPLGRRIIVNAALVKEEGRMANEEFGRGGHRLHPLRSTTNTTPPSQLSKVSREANRSDRELSNIPSSRYKQLPKRRVVIQEIPCSGCDRTTDFRDPGGSHHPHPSPGWMSKVSRHQPISTGTSQQRITRHIRAFLETDQSSCRLFFARTMPRIRLLFPLLCLTGSRNNKHGTSGCIY